MPDVFGPWTWARVLTLTPEQTLALLNELEDWRGARSHALTAMLVDVAATLSAAATRLDEAAYWLRQDGNDGPKEGTP